MYVTVKTLMYGPTLPLNTPLTGKLRQILNVIKYDFKQL